ncbi:hypothetical protein BJF83_08135 [Nocardiopsis sp. CNR-923]|uniref:hypothetical protein n=1 Tax=Nocardiopsis sp. CNR-923 TaxID=1904965 RepID=UPI00095EBD2E|nr:hypothetical protein [Nocardiopsis sp. CNR-923]OLT30653.1 hypothetical protein BJF83_08135 [Nocardiopsis sp. CNR-923]
MVFHPPTFEPGPVATAIGVALIVCPILRPLVLRPLYAAARRPVPPQGPSPLVRLNRALAWWSLGEVLGGMLFIGTATGVAPADIGLAWPAFDGFADRPGLLAAASCATAFLALFVVQVLMRARVLWRHWGGTFRRRSGRGSRAVTSPSCRGPRRSAGPSCCPRWRGSRAGRSTSTGSSSPSS